MRKTRLAGLCASALLATAPIHAPAQEVYRDTTAWLDDAGRPWQLQGLRGRASVLTLAYGACRRICSTSLRIMERVQALADRRGLDLDFVVVGLDPAEDRPADWAAFRSERGLSRANWHFLTGDAAGVAAMARLLGVKVWRIDSHLMHDFKIVLLSPQGRVLREMSRFGESDELLLP